MLQKPHFGQNLHYLLSHDPAQFHFKDSGNSKKEERPLPTPTNEVIKNPSNTLRDACVHCYTEMSVCVCVCVHTCVCVRLCNDIASHSYGCIAHTG